MEVLHVDALHVDAPSRAPVLAAVLPLPSWRICSACTIDRLLID